MAIFTASFAIELIAVVTTLILGFVAYVNYKYTYWAKIGLPSLKPKFPHGTVPESNRRLHYGELHQEFYKRIKRNGYKHAGYYSSLSPLYMPVDPEIIKCILQKDFQHFINHGVKVNEEIDPLEAHLFNLEDDKWRKMRVKLTPTFTSGKMKMMFQTLTDCTGGLKDIMDDAAKEHTPLDIKEVLARFTTDIIGSVAFGVNCNSLKDPNAEFRKHGKRIFETDKSEMRKRYWHSILPQFLAKLIRLKITKPEVEDFFMKMIKEAVDYREKNNVVRKDFLQLLIELKNKGFVSDDEKTSESNKIEKGLTINELAAQAFVFFLAGFETSSTTMTFALCEIARHPEIQEKMREEINTVLAKHGGEMSYAAIMEMTYMEQVLNETLRMYPPVPILIRQCTKDYTIPNTSIVIEKGVKVNISSLGLHRDPEFYPDPEKFDPERFSEENKKTRPDFTWLPFGEGPRLCIGLRFGMLQSRVGIATILRDYRITLNEKTKIPIQFDLGSLVSSVQGGVWLDVDKIN